MKNILETVIGWYKNYANLTKKQRKLQAVRRTVEILKEQLGNEIDNINIKWVPEKGEAEAVLWLRDNANAVNLLYEIWRYIYPECDIRQIDIVVTTYPLSNEFTPTKKEEAELIFNTSLLTEKIYEGKYANYIKLCEEVIDDITVYIYIRVIDREETDDC